MNDANDVKSVLAKKKQLLEECKQRKKEREQQKVSDWKKRDPLF